MPDPEKLEKLERVAPETVISSLEKLSEASESVNVIMAVSSAFKEERSDAILVMVGLTVLTERLTVLEAVLPLF